LKKKLALVLAVVFTLMLMSSCSGNTTPPAATSTPAAEETAAPTAAETAAPSEEPDNGLPFATDDRGIATEPYNYPLPLTTSDEVITYWWSTYSPQFIPAGKTYQETALPQEAYARTGVNVEYVDIPTASRTENFGVLLASDDLCDIMSYATMYYPGTPLQMVEDGYFANILDYAEYMPNYLYQSTYANPSDRDTYESVFYGDDVVPIAWLLWSTDIVVDSGYCVRQDWLDKIGKKADDVVTWDDLEETLLQIKTAIDSCEFPMWLSSMIEIGGYWQFNSFDNISVITTRALPPIFLDQSGNVQMGCTTDGDKALMTKFNSFYNQGLINPDWQSYWFAQQFSAHTYNSEVFYQSMGASGIPDVKRLTADPDCDWRAIQRPLVTEDQIIHVGTVRSRTATGHACFAAKNNNLELAMKWIDYRYSPEGWELFCYGPEGLLVEKDENGNRRNTEYSLSNPDGMDINSLFGLYTVGQLVEPGMVAYDKALLNPNGEIPLATINSWTTWQKAHYDGTGALPLGVRLNVEQSNAVNEYRTDIITYIAETYSSFLDGSYPLSKWDDYQSTLDQMGRSKILEIYQEAYDYYLSKKA
jgi:putative aldouronate transport system substrate-binding protein